MKFFVFVLALLLVPLAFANPEVTTVFDGLRIGVVNNYQVERDTSAVLRVQVFNETGSKLTGTNVTCTYTAYSGNGTMIASGSMASGASDYSATVGAGNTTSIGRYPFIINCVGVGVGAYVNTYFVVSAHGIYNEDYAQNLGVIAVIIILPFLLAVLMVIGSITLDPEEHWALKIGLFLASYLPFYLSLWWGAEAVGSLYNFPTLTDAIGDGSFYFILFFILLLFYVVMYFIVKIFATTAKAKAEKMSY